MKLVRRADLGVTFADDGSLLIRSVGAGIGARVPAVAVGILAYCSEPRSAAEVVRAFGAPAEELLRGLADAGLLLPPDDARRTPRFFGNFGALDVHRRMLADRARIEAYRAALAAVVRPGCSVLDAGTGSGLLAALAARAGAGRVIAVDASDAVELARETVGRSGLSERVEVVRGDFAELALDEPVEVIVTETFGAFALAEGGVGDVGRCAERNLAPGGVVIPRAVELWLAPVGGAAVQEEALGAFEGIAGVDLGGLRQAALGRGITLDIPPEALLHPGQRLRRFDFPREGGTHRGALAFGPLAGGAFRGLAGWFVLDLCEGVSLPTGPADPATHWHQVYLPIEPVQIAEGARLECEVQVAPAGDDRRAVEVAWSWRVGPLQGRANHRIR